MARWEYVLAKAETMEEIGRFSRPHDRTLSVDLNKSGSAAFWIPTSEKYAKLVWPWSTALIARYIDDADVVTNYWSGPIVSRTTSMAQGKMDIAAVGWFERLMHLNLQTRLEFVNADATAIAGALLNAARTLDPRMNITLGDMETTQLRTITYELDQNIGQAILDLAALESGYDWYIDPTTRRMNFVAKMGTVRPKLRWNLIADGKSEHSNLSECVEVVDGSVLVNDIRPRGAFASGIATDVVSQAQYGVFMEQPSLANVVNTNILNAFANGELVYRSQPRVTYTMTPKPSTHPNSPRLFKNFQLGDTGYLTARRDFIQVIDQAERMFGVSLSIFDNGTEQITNLQTTAS